MRTSRQKHKAKAKTQEARSAKRKATQAAKTALPKPATVQITFANEAAADHFAQWLCGSGEQHYWNWMEAREADDADSGDITAVAFDYHSQNDGKFGLKIAAKCGRLR